MFYLSGRPHNVREKVKARIFHLLLYFHLIAVALGETTQNQEPGTSFKHSAWVAAAQAVGPSSATSPSASVGRWTISRATLIWVGGITGRSLTYLATLPAQESTFILFERSIYYIWFILRWKRFFHLVVHSPKAHNNQSWARPKPA